MERSQIIVAAEAFVKEALSGEASGHDWYHVDRVRHMAVRLAKEEGADVILFACTGFSTIHLKQFAKDRVTIPMVDLVEAQAVAYKLQ